MNIIDLSAAGVRNVHITSRETSTKSCGTRCSAGSTGGIQQDTKEYACFWKIENTEKFAAVMRLGRTIREHDR